MTTFTFGARKSFHSLILTIRTISSDLLMLGVVWLSLLLPVQVAAQTSIQRPVSTGSLAALKTLSPITVDGNLNESVWSQANFVTFSNRLRSDNTVKVSVLWDDANLYFAYDVTDAELEALNDINKLSRDDGAEIYIDAQNNKGITRDANDYAFFASINDLAKPSTISAKTLTRSGGYTMEIVIPWSAIATVPVAGKVLGLLLANNDRDFGKSFQFDWLGLINTGSYNRPNLWGNLTLSSMSIDSSIPTLHPPITATLLGQTGEDSIGTQALGRGGVPDVHVRLSGVSGTIANIRITGLDGIWEMPLNAQGNWLVATVPTTDPSVVDVFFDYYKSITVYTLAITYTDGNSQTVVTTPSTFNFSFSNVGDKSVNAGSSVTNTITAALISGSSQEISFSVAGLPSGTTGSFSQAACNASCSSVLTVNSTAGTSRGTFPITVTAKGGGVTKTTTFMLAVLMTVATPTISPGQTAHAQITATLLGQTGEDVTGTRALGRDGVPDVHVRLSGVSGTIANIRITGLDGIWQMPLNAQGNWLVATLPTGDPSVVDVFFDYYKPINTYTLAITYTDGQRQRVHTKRSGTAAPTPTPIVTPIIPALFDFSLSNAGNKSVNSGSSVNNTITASMLSGTNQQISFSIAGQPSGSMASFSSGTCSPNCSTVITINATGSTPGGNFPITVTATGGGANHSTSFTLTVAAPRISSGQTYYVSSGMGPGAKAPGNDANPGTEAAPFLTIARACRVMARGGTLNLKAGVYLGGQGQLGSDACQNGINDNQRTNIVSVDGVGQARIRMYPPAGITEQQLADSWRQPPDCPTSDPTNQTFRCANGVESSIGGMQVLDAPCKFDGGRYVNITGIICGSLPRISAAVSARGGYLKFEDVEIVGSVYSGVADSGGSGHNIYRRVNVHDNGWYDRFHHGIYTKTGGNLIEDSHIWNNKSHGIHQYGCTSTTGGGGPIVDNCLGNIIRNNNIHDHPIKAGVLLWSAGSTEVYNNTIWNSSVGVWVQYGGHVYNNTLYNNDWGIFISNQSFVATIENNIIAGSKSYNVITYPSSNTHIARNNLLSGGKQSTTNVSLSNNIINQDPLVVNAAAADFRLQAGSPAIGKATDGGNMGAR